MEYILQQQDIVRKNEATINFNDRGYHFGDGIYEVVRTYDGKAFAMDQHIDRFFASAEKLDLNMTITKEECCSLIHQLIEKNELNTGIVYFQMTRGVQSRNHLYQREIEPVLVGYTEELPRKHQLLQEGVDLLLTDDIRWLRCDIKTINLLGNVMAKREAADANCHEAIMHRDGTVTEGSSSNLFLVKGQTLYTHPASNLILNGITRQIVIDLANKVGLTVIEEAFPVDVLSIADEAFITSTTMEITPVRQIKGQAHATLEIGPITRQLQAEFEKLLP